MDFDNKEVQTALDNSKKEQIRVCLSGLYDLQTIRIQIGNRVVANFYRKLGIQPSESPKVLEEGGKKEDKLANKLLKDLQAEYARLADGIVCNKLTIRKQIEKFDACVSDKEPTKMIRDYQDFELVRSYMLIVESEKHYETVLEDIVHEHPMWEHFFKGAGGCGFKTAAACLAYLDPYKARHVSSFFRYAGLDTVQDTDKAGNRLFLTTDGTYRKVKIKEISTEDGSLIYEDADGNEYTGEAVASEHGRRKGDTEMYEYISKEGKKELKRGITYNPKLKMVLVGRFADVIIRKSTTLKDTTYVDILFDYLNRLNNHEYHKNDSKAKKLAMAKRYMCKQFLRNLWVSWREFEGLPVDNPYEVEKLGHAPHKYNQYQVDTARKSVM